MRRTKRTMQFTSIVVNARLARLFCWYAGQIIVSHTTPEYESLLRSGIQAARRGQVSLARSLFRAILRERPDETRAWLALAGVAESREVQHDALQQALALDPSNVLAQRGLQRLQQDAPLAATLQTPAPMQYAGVYVDELDAQPVPGPAGTIEQNPSYEALDQRAPVIQERFRNIPGWLVIAGLAAALGLALGYFLLPSLNRGPVARETTPTLPLASRASPLPAVIITPVAPTNAIATARPVPPTAVLGQEPGGSQLPTARPIPTIVVPPAPLAMGTLQEYDGWSATLLRPDYAMALEGPIGDLRPNGRFVFALLSVSNGDTLPRRLPADLFVLVDQQGRSYSPAPGTSSAYLAIFGRGQYGDLALEDEFAPGGSLFSVPVLFDVPLDSSGLLLTIAGDRSAGWQVLEGAPAPQNVNTGP